MWESVGSQVTVPSVVGLPFAVAQAVAAAAGVTLANPDPDGPPIGAIAWRGDFFVSRQEPPPGAVVARHSSLVVQIQEHRPDDGVTAPNNTTPTPPTVVNHAEPDVKRFVDLADNHNDVAI